MTPATRALLVVWLLVVGASLYLYFFHRDAIYGDLHQAFSVSIATGCLVYLVLGCLRGFTLIPSTYLVLGAVPFLPPAPLLAVTVLGIAVSSSSIYYLSAAFRLDEYFERRHNARVAWMKASLERHELPIIIGWSFFPFAPTDLMCYACGVLRVDFKTFLFGVCLGEGAICAIYIYAGDYALRWLQFRP